MSTPFETADAAWLWTMAALVDRQRGIVSKSVRDVAPITPDDVVRCLDALYRNRRIDLLHARILRIYGERGRAPAPNNRAEACDWRIWREALDRLAWPLRKAGIVVDSSNAGIAA